MGKITAMTALTGTGAAVGDVLPIVDVSAGTSGSKKITMAEFLNAFGTINAAGTALVGTGFATGDQIGIWDISATAFKYVTAAELLNGIVTVNAAGTALTGANTATDDQFLIYDLSATAAKYITRAELEVAMKTAKISAEMVTLSGATSITAATHGGRTGLMTGTGSSLAQTLPAASGTGAIFRFVVGAVNTSNHVIKVANASDVMKGQIDILDNDSNALTAYAASGTDDTITLNGTTTGGQIGDWIECQDIATNTWLVTGKLVCPAGSNVADMLSATV